MAANKQYFGFASYDVDKKRIEPIHVLKSTGSTDTHLAQPLEPGQTQVVLENATGWYKGMTNHMRSLAWYGHQDSTGHYYADYTYTRNVLQDAWNSGQISGNVITLRTPWSGPPLAAGTSVRNAMSGGMYNYAALSAGAVPDQWTSYTATISGLQKNGVESATKFRPGTAFIKPLILANHHGNTSNQVSWRNVTWSKAAPESYRSEDAVDLRVANLPLGGSPLSYRWTQISGPTAELRNSQARVATVLVPSNSGEAFGFRVEVSNGPLSVRNTVVVNGPPLLTGMERTVLAYTADDDAMALTSTLSVSDFDDDLLRGATIQIATNFQNGQDLLSFANTTAISGNWNASTGTLTLNGVDTATNYQAALRTVSYRNTNDVPSEALRTIDFQVTDGQGTSNTLSRGLVVSQTSVTSVALDTSTFGGKDQISSTAAKRSIFGDDFVPVDISRSYQLSGSARSGDGAGGLYKAANKQYFGFASYDIDKKRIEPLHVLKVTGATDTRLAQSLLPGQSQVVLENAAGWYAGNTSHMRSLAWYGYQDNTGHTYSEYTYTRNVLLNAWDAGQISGNVITLRVPWAGPALAQGTAVRNSMSGGTYNYAALSARAVPDQWTNYAATIFGIQQNGVDAATKFRPGTVYIKPLILANYQGNTSNLVTWREVSWRRAASESYQAGDVVDLRMAELPALGSPLSYAWTQISGPTADLQNAGTRIATVEIPTDTSQALLFQVEVRKGSNLLLKRTVTISFE